MLALKAANNASDNNTRRSAEVGASPSQTSVESAVFASAGTFRTKFRVISRFFEYNRGFLNTINGGLYLLRTSRGQSAAVAIGSLSRVAKKRITFHVIFLPRETSPTRARTQHRRFAPVNLTLLLSAWDERVTRNKTNKYVDCTDLIFTKWKSTRCGDKSRPDREFRFNLPISLKTRDNRYLSIVSRRDSPENDTNDRNNRSASVNSILTRTFADVSPRRKKKS